MAYPYVSQGDQFTPSAALENDIRRMVNEYSGGGMYGGGQPMSPATSLTLRVCPGASVTVGQPVELTGGTACEDRGIFKAGTWTLNSDLPLGVITKEAAANEVTGAVVSGAAWCKVASGSATSFIEPTNGDHFIYSDSGYPVIYNDGTGMVMALIGQGGIGGDSENRVLWAEQSGSGSPASGIAVTLYEYPGATASVGSGLAFCEPMNTETTITGAKFWVAKAKVRTYTEEQ